MAEDNLATEIQLLIDRVKIVETIKRLTFHMDKKDWQSYQAEFADQVEVDFTDTAFGGKTTRVASRAQWAAAVASGLARFFETQHFASNYFVEIDGDRARAITYFIARHFMKAPGGGKYVLDQGGYYTHGLIKVNGVWKVNLNKLTPLWDQGDSEALKLAQAGGLSKEWAELFGL
jgi:SnoaL-like protein